MNCKFMRRIGARQKELDFYFNAHRQISIYSIHMYIQYICFGWDRKKQKSIKLKSQRQEDNSLMRKKPDGNQTVGSTLVWFASSLLTLPISKNVTFEFSGTPFYQIRYCCCCCVLCAAAAGRAILQLVNSMRHKFTKRPKRKAEKLKSEPNGGKQLHAQRPPRRAASTSLSSML